MARYSDRRKFFLDDELYKKLLSQRDRRSIVHYESPTLPPKDSALTRQLNIDYFTWLMVHNYYKVASKVYGRRELWWVIAWYNEKPSDTLIERGETIKIPRPVETVISYVYSR